MLSDLVRQLCKEKNISQSELARRIGTSKQNLFKKMKADTLGSKDIELIEKALDVELKQCFVSADGETIVGDDSKLSAAKKTSFVHKNVDVDSRIKKLEEEKDIAIKKYTHIKDMAVCYVKADNLIKKGDYEAGIEMAKQGLSVVEKDSEAEIYLNLICATGYAYLKDVDNAKVYYKAAKNAAAKLDDYSYTKDYGEVIKGILRDRRNARF